MGPALTTSKEIGGALEPDGMATPFTGFKSQRRELELKDNHSNEVATIMNRLNGGSLFSGTARRSPGGGLLNKTGLALLGAVGLLAGCAAVDSSGQEFQGEDELAVAEVEQATIGGTIVPVGSRNSTELAVVGIRTPGANTSFCTGTLLRSNWVLTARHCAATSSNAPRSDLVVVHDRGNTVAIPSANVFLHPNLATDAALLKLPTSINVGQANIALFRGADSDALLKSVTLYGYGSNGAVTPAPLTKITSKIDYIENNRSMQAGVSADMYNRRYLHIAGSTPGDSGGPSFLNGQLVGITGGNVYKVYSKVIAGWVNGLIAPSSSVQVGSSVSYGSNMAPGVTITMSGDFNGDDYADIVQFNQDSGPAGSVYVLLGTSNGIGAMTRWHTGFSVGQEIPVVGDVDGDGRDDIIKANTSNGDVHVALSTGTSFGTSTKYHENFISAGSRFAAADMNGDARADIVGFLPTGRVIVSQSCGSVANVYPLQGSCSAPNKFSPSSIVWREGFWAGSDTVRVGDTDGDGFGDLVRFSQANRQAIVSRTARYACTTDADCGPVGGGPCAGTSGVCWGSPGNGGLSSVVWSSSSSRTGETPVLADLNDDGRADVANFETTTAFGRNGYFSTQLSSGTSFGALVTRGTDVCPSGRKCFVGDIGRDGRDDLFISGGGNVSAYIKRVTP